jgi:hypothetical protein
MLLRSLEEKGGAGGVGLGRNVRYLLDLLLMYLRGMINVRGLVDRLWGLLLEE